MDIKKIYTKLSIDQINNCFDQNGNIIIEKLYCSIHPNSNFCSTYNLHHNITFEELSEVLSEYKAVNVNEYINNTSLQDEPRVGSMPLEQVKKQASMFYLEIDDLPVFLRYYKNELEIRYDIDSKEELNKLIEKLISASKPDVDKKINFISYTGYNWDMQSSKIEKATKIDFNLNYNSDFNHEKVVSLLKDPNDGLILLGGEAGSGKTNFIRWLINNTDRKFVYMPSNQVPLMSEPSFISFALNELKDCVIVLEDCEDVLISRDEMKRSEVQTILNLSDGILGTALNLTILGTYNTKDNIDKALFRKGRLLYMYDFDKLDAEKATKLSAELGFNVKYEKPTILSDVYNTEETHIVKPKRTAVGFQRNHAT